MSEPVIPERYKLQHSGFVGILTNGSEDGNGFVELLVIKLMGDLGAAEAKVAELERKVALQQLGLDAKNGPRLAEQEQTGKAIEDLKDGLREIIRRAGTCDNSRCSQHAKLVLGLINTPAYGDWAYRRYKELQDARQEPK